MLCRSYDGELYCICLCSLWRISICRVRRFYYGRANNLFNLYIDDKTWLSRDLGIRNLLKWVKITQIRALQDIAIGDEEEFVKMWCTSTHEVWGNQSKTWNQALRIREDTDIRWVCNESTQIGSSATWELRHCIKGNIHKLQKLLIEEDDNWWHMNHNRDDVMAGYLKAPPKIAATTLEVKTGEVEYKMNIVCPDGQVKETHSTATIAMANDFGPGAALRMSEDGPSNFRGDKEENVVHNTVQLGEGERHSTEVIIAPAVLNSIHAMLGIDREMQNFDDISYTKIVVVEQNNTKRMHLYERQEGLTLREEVKDPNETFELATEELQLGGECMAHKSL